MGSMGIFLTMGMQDENQPYHVAAYDPLFLLGPRLLGEGAYVHRWYHALAVWVTEPEPCETQKPSRPETP